MARLAIEDVAEGAARLTRGDEVAVELAEGGGHLVEGQREGHAIAHPLAQARGEIAQDVRAAVLHGVQRGLELQAGGEQVAEFLRELDDLRAAQLDDRF